MYDFCPHCGQTIEQEEIAGQMLVCIHCNKPIGFVQELENAPAQDASPAARCPVCQQLVELKTVGVNRTLVPHYRAGTRKICPGSGKPSP